MKERQLGRIRSALWPRVYLETSALNALWRDSCSDTLIDLLVHGPFELLTGESVAQELCAAGRRDGRRELLRRTLVRLFPNLRFLLDTPTLLGRSLHGYDAGWDSSRYYSYSEWDEKLKAFIRGKQFSDEDAAKLRDHNERRGKWMPETNEAVRPTTQEDLKGEAALRAGEYLRRTINDEAHIKGLKLTRVLGDRVPDLVTRYQDRTAEILAKVEPWRAFFTAFALNIHQATVAKSDYGRRKVPGFLDVEQMVYLPACDQFVSNDVYQYRLARRTVRACGLRCEVQSYDRFRERLMIMAATAHEYR